MHLVRMETGESVRGKTRQKTIAVKVLTYECEKKNQGKISQNSG